MTRLVAISLVTIGFLGAAAQLFAYLVYLEPSLLGVAFFAIVAAIGLLHQRDSWLRKALVSVVVAVSALSALAFVAATAFGLHWQPRIVSASAVVFFSALLIMVTRAARTKALNLVCIIALLTLVVTQAWWLRLAREDSFMRQGERIMIWRKVATGGGQLTRRLHQMPTAALLSRESSASVRGPRREPQGRQLANNHAWRTRRVEMEGPSLAGDRSYVGTRFLDKRRDEPSRGIWVVLPRNGRCPPDRRHP